MKAIVFGANGYLGSAIVDELSKNSFEVTTSSRSSDETEFQTQDGFDAIIASGKKFNACIWAQGQNAQDTLSSAKNFEAVFEANVLYTIKSLTALIENGLLAPQARLVVLSSVWQSSGLRERVCVDVFQDPCGSDAKALLPFGVNVPWALG